MRKYGHKPAASHRQQRAKGYDVESTWSSWTWNEQQKKHIRSRINAEGHKLSEYWDPDTNTPVPFDDGNEVVQDILARDYQTYNTGSFIQSEDGDGGTSSTTDYQASPFSVHQSNEHGTFTPRHSSYHVADAYETPNADPARLLGSLSINDESDSSAAVSFDSKRLSADFSKQLDFVIIKDGRRFFKVGRVFKCMWFEPAGTGTEDEHIESTSYTFPTKAGQVFHKVRHFIVVKEKPGHSICVALNTYGGQGTMKHGIHPIDHAAVFPSTKKRATLREGERLDKKEFSIVVENPQEKIDPMSRINFGKIYTVEHNVKVCKVGRIHQNDLPSLIKYFAESITGSNEMSGVFSQGTMPTMTPGQLSEAGHGATTTLGFPDPVYLQHYGSQTQQSTSGPYIGNTFFPANPGSQYASSASTGNIYFTDAQGYPQASPASNYYPANPGSQYAGNAFTGNTYFPSTQGYPQASSANNYYTASSGSQLAQNGYAGNNLSFPDGTIANTQHSEALDNDDGYDSKDKIGLESSRVSHSKHSRGRKHVVSRTMI
ncbi:hypothetical protein B0O99DRAFT_592936 [Bisporella sp. PMI_857]|nr:hypothetical protein B0O99DRAFT_592936 [Bisporella sp. PMI_857]